MVLNEQQRAQSVAGGDGERAAPLCRADDLKSFLNQLSHQIADADRRHSETLRDMHDRLSRLGDRASELKDTLPKAFEADIERLENGMARLTDQIATPRQPTADPMARSQSLGEPPALRSAMPNGAAHVVSPHTLSHPRDDEPWDRNAAEALADLYDSGEAGPARTRNVQDFGTSQPAAKAAPVVSMPPLSLPSSPLAIAMPVHEDVADPAVDGIRAPSYDNAHLDQRLDEIAARLDQSLSAIRGDRSLADLNVRFDQLEESWTSALSGVATRTDIEGLRMVETHIAELSERIERTQAHLKRLDAIEHQLTDLGTRLSDENIVNLFGSLVPSEQDLTRFAEQAADRTASIVASGQSHVAALAAPAISPAFEANQVATEQRLGVLQQMLSGFIDERRQGAVETSEALITLQEAMQVMLDRVEAIETKVVSIPAATMAPVTQMALQQNEPDRRAPVQRAPIEPDYEPEERAPSNAAFEEAKAAARAAKAAANRSGAGDRMQAMPVDLDQHDAGLAIRGAASVRQEQSRVTTPTGAEMRGVRGQDPRTAARRPAETVETAAAPAKAGVRDRIMGSAAGSEKSAMKSGMILIPCALLLLAGYWLLMTPKNRGLAPTAARMEQPSQAGKRAIAPSQANPNGPAIDTEDAPSKPAPASTPGQTELDAPRDAVPVKNNQSDAGPHINRDLDHAQIQTGNVVAPTAGITVQTGHQTLTPDDIAASRQQMHLAAMSQRTAYNAAEMAAARPVAVPAAVRQSDEAPVETPTAQQPDDNARPVLELPPATVGPLSLRLAAAKGDPSAQFEVAARFAEGKGIKQDFGQAAAWYQRAATQGSPAAQYRLAALFERGLGVKADIGRAKVWYTRAAEQGNIKAMHNLAVLSAGQDQASADYATAALWFSEAAERGLSDSQYNLGVLNESGLGLPRNLVAAYKWYSLAARGGDKESARRRDILRTKLDATTLASAEASVTNWRAAPVETAANDAISVGTAWQKRSTTAAVRSAN